MESLENKNRVFQPSHSPWKSQKAGFPHSHSSDDYDFYSEQKDQPQGGANIRWQAGARFRQYP